MKFHGYLVHGYLVQKDGAENYRITPPGSLPWDERAVNLETARKWIEQHRAERRNQVKRVELASIMAPEELKD